MAHTTEFDAHEPLTAAPAVARGLPRLYVLGWAGMAGVAAGYLGLVVLNRYEPARPVREFAAPLSAPVPGAAIADVVRMRQLLKDYQQDVSHLRADLEARAQDPATIGTLAAIEERMSIETGTPVVRVPVAAVPLPPRADTPLAAVVSAQPAAASVPAVTEAPPAAVAVQAPARAAGKAVPALQPLALSSDQIETGTLQAPAKPAGLPKAVAGPGMPAAVAAAPAAIAFGAPVVKAEPKPFAVHLASGQTIDSIRLSWSLLSDQHADTLKNLQPRVTSTGTEEAGQTFDLVAGPIKTAADAKKLCKALAARGTDCKVSPFAGEGL